MDEQSWTDAFEKRSTEGFEAALAPDVVLNASSLVKPIVGRELFGIPGDFVLPFFKVIEESGILPHYTLSHGAAVGFAADAAARYR